MLRLNLDNGSGPTYRILCLGAHSDDIEIGCGGAVLTLQQKHQHLSVYWVVFGASQERMLEARTSADRFLESVESKTIIVKEFRDGFFPFAGSAIKDYFEQLKEEFTPNLIFTHHRNDLHQDHRTICELTWNTFRDHLICEYEIPKYDGDLGTPNLFVHLDEATCRKKVRYILDSFRSQADNHWFGEDSFLALLRLRGIECNSPSKYAEAFYCRKVVLG